MKKSMREVALKILYKTEQEGGFANLLLSHELDGVAGTPGETQLDKAFASNLVYGVLKNRIALDYIIAKFSKIKPDRLSVWVRNILRLGVFQMYYMDKVPHSAAVNESVKLAKRYANIGAVGFVNGVLRSVSREIENIKLPEKSGDLIKYFSVNYSHPARIVEKLIKQYGAEVCEEILRANNQTPDIFLRVNLLKATVEELCTALEADGITTEVDSEIPYCVKVTGGTGGITKTAAYTSGLYSIQDRSSMLASRAVDVKPGDVVLDMCAAPGGKATHMAEIMQNSGNIIACDIYNHKLELISAAVKRLGLNIISTALSDGTQFVAEFEGRFDKILLDAPCSGLGVIHKKPDIRYKDFSELGELVKIQEQMLDNAARYIKPGGTLVYSTCTVLEEENQLQTERFMQRHGNFELLEETQLFTHKTGGNGFYIAKMKRKT